MLGGANLTQKASLNAVSSALDYVTRILVGLVLTPLLVTGLGGYYYGMWQIAMRTIGYLNPASGRPTEALKWTLAHHQKSTDYEQKREYVGSALVVALLFLPLTFAAGVVIVWIVPSLFDAPAAYVWPIRLTLILLVVNTAAAGIAGIPRAVLQGENLAYKRMGLSALFVVAGGVLTWLALALDLGLAGVAGAALVTTIITGAFFLLVVRRYAPWFGVRIPPFRETRAFFGLSVWFMLWNLVMILMTSSDVIILGLFDSVEQAGSYTLTKYAPEMTVMIISMIVFGVTPGLGGIIGSGEMGRAIRLRSEMLAITWLLATALCATVLLWNRTFIGLWVGDEYYLGTLACLLIVLVVIQFVLIRNDSNIIDLTLNLPVKVSIGLASAALSVVLASILTGYFEQGVVGLSIGLLAGRAILSVAYPAMVGRFLGVRPSAQIRGSIRPLLVTALFFGAAFLLDTEQVPDQLPFARTWPGFFLLAGFTFCGVTVIGYTAGLTRRQRRRVIERFGSLLKPGGPADTTPTRPPD